MGYCCCIKRKKKRRIVLLLVGLDNAGKTAAAKGLAGESLDSVMPTVGFSIINLKYGNYDVQIFDLGGGNNIRGIWGRYFVDAHGVIFVVDSSDYERLPEVRNVLAELILHEKISGKPVLLLANKQDHRDALDEIDLVESLKLEEIVNKAQCPTLIETCCANQMSNKLKLDPGIKNGYCWLVNFIIRQYASLNIRVENDVRIQEMEEQLERKHKLERLRAKNDKQTRESNLYAIEKYSEHTSETNGIKNHSENLNTYKDTSEILIIKSSDNYNENSSDSNSLVTVYHGNVYDAFSRPKSAREMVKEQLQLETCEGRRPSLKVLFRPKTAPVHIYGDNRGKEKEFSEKKTLKSAGDSIFVISNGKASYSEKCNENQTAFDLNTLSHEGTLLTKPQPTVNGLTKTRHFLDDIAI